MPLAYLSVESLLDSVAGWSYEQWNTSYELRRDTRGRGWRVVVCYRVDGDRAPSYDTEKTLLSGYTKPAAEQALNHFQARREAKERAWARAAARRDAAERRAQDAERERLRDEPCNCPRKHGPFAQTTVYRCNQHGYPTLRACGRCGGRGQEAGSTRDDPAWLPCLGCGSTGVSGHNNQHGDLDAIVDARAAELAQVA